VPIIRRKNCIYVALDTYYSACMPVWYAAIPSCIPDCHPHRITSTKCRINTVVSLDDGQIVARNTYRLINILKNKHTKKNCATSWLYLQNYTVMYGQQNTKLWRNLLRICVVMQDAGPSEIIFI